MRTLLVVALFQALLMITLLNTDSSTHVIVCSAQEHGDEDYDDYQDDEEEEDDHHIPRQGRGESHLPPRPTCCDYRRNCACITPEADKNVLNFGSRRFAIGAVELLAVSPGTTRDVTLFSLRYRTHTSHLQKVTDDGSTVATTDGNYTDVSVNDPGLRHMMQDLSFEVDLQTFHPRIPGTDDDFAYTGERRGNSGIRNNISSAEMKSHRHRKQMLGSPFPKVLVRSEYLATPSTHHGQNKFSSRSSAMSGPPGSVQGVQYDSFDQHEMGWEQRDHMKTANPDWLHRATMRFQLDEKQVKEQPVLFAVVWKDYRTKGDHDPWSWKNEEAKIFEQRQKDNKGEEEEDADGYLHWHYRPASELNVYVPIAKWQPPSSIGTMESPSYHHHDRRGINVLLNGSTFLRLAKHAMMASQDGAKGGSTVDEEDAETVEMKKAMHEKYLGESRGWFTHILSGANFYRRQVFYTLKTRWGINDVHVSCFTVIFVCAVALIWHMDPKERPTCRGVVTHAKRAVVHSWKSFVYFLRWTGFLPPLPVEENAEEAPEPQAADNDQLDQAHLAGSPVLSTTNLGPGRRGGGNSRLFAQDQLAGTRGFDESRPPARRPMGTFGFGGRGFGTLDTSGSTNSSNNDFAGVDAIIASAGARGNAGEVQRPPVWPTGDPRWRENAGAREQSVAPGGGASPQRW